MTTGPPGSGWRRVVWALGAIAGLVCLGLIAARPQVGGWEHGLFAAFNGLGGAWWWVLFPVMQVGTLAAGPVAALLALARRRRVLAVQLAATGLAAWVSARGVKALVGRPRPVVLLDEVVVRGGEAGGLGYPSGHVSVAMALAMVVAPYLPGRWRWVVFAIVLSVGVARMYVGAHLPLDVLGGILLGGVLGLGSKAVVHRLAAHPRGPSIAD